MKGFVEKFIKRKSTAIRRRPETVGTRQVVSLSQQLVDERRLALASNADYRDYARSLLRESLPIEIIRPLGPRSRLVVLAGAGNKSGVPGAARIRGMASAMLSILVAPAKRRTRTWSLSLTHHDAAIAIDHLPVFATLYLTKMPGRHENENWHLQPYCCVVFELSVGARRASVVRGSGAEYGTDEAHHGVAVGNERLEKSWKSAMVWRQYFLCDRLDIARE